MILPHTALTQFDEKAIKAAVSKTLKNLRSGNLWCHVLDIDGARPSRDSRSMQNRYRSPMLVKSPFHGHRFKLTQH